MEVVFITLVALAGLLAFVHMGGQIMTERMYRRAEGVWRQFAERHRGEWHEVGGLYPQPPGWVSVVVDRAHVMMGLSQPREGPASTMTGAGFASRRGPVFEARRRGAFAPNTIALELDETVVAGAEREAIEALWTAHARRAMSAIPGAHVVSDGRVVRVTMTGVVVDMSILDPMLDLAAALASFGAVELAALEALPRARLVPHPDGEMKEDVLVFETPRGQVHVWARIERGPPKIVLLLAIDRALPRCSIVVRGGRIEGELPPGFERQSGLLERCGEAALEIRARELSIALPLTASADAVESATDLLVALAGGTPGDGAFR